MSGPDKGNIVAVAGVMRVATDVSVTPSPTDEETAAIVAALELAWPRPMMLVEDPAHADSSRWRWSGRWWAVRDGGPADRRRP